MRKRKASAVQYLLSSPCSWVCEDMMSSLYEGVLNTYNENCSKNIDRDNYNNNYSNNDYNNDDNDNNKNNYSASNNYSTSALKIISCNGCDNYVENKVTR